MSTSFIESNQWVPSFNMYLFDGDSAGDGGTQTSGTDGDSTQDGDTTSESSTTTAMVVKPQQKRTQTRTQSRDVREPRDVVNTNGSSNGVNGVEELYELRRELDDARTAADAAKDRIGELNKENQKRRKDAETLEGRLNVADRRVIRAEAIEALQAEGVIHKRIVDIFLSDVGDKAKIDPKTGDAIGIRENLSQWKEAHKEFFKPPVPATDTTAQTTATETQTTDKGTQATDKGSQSTDKGTQTTTETQTQSDDATKKNATSTGASTAGAASGSKATGGLPDLRTLDPKARREAMVAYKQSMRFGGGLSR